MRDKLCLVDDVGHSKTMDILLILPESDAESAQLLARKIKFQVTRFKQADHQSKIPTLIAVATWEKSKDENCLLKDLTEQLESNDYDQVSPTMQIS